MNTRPFRCPHFFACNKLLELVPANKLDAEGRAGRNRGLRAYGEHQAAREKGVRARQRGQGKPEGSADYLFFFVADEVAMAPDPVAALKQKIVDASVLQKIVDAHGAYWGLQRRYRTAHTRQHVARNMGARARSDRHHTRAPIATPHLAIQRRLDG